MTDLIKIENGTILATERGYELIARAREVNELKKQVDLAEKQFKTEVLKAMEDNNIKKFENDLVTITYKAPTTRKTIDSKALKEQGLYDSFVKESNVKSSVMVKYKD